MEITGNYQNQIETQAWYLYQQEQALLSNLSQAVGNAGNPDSNPNFTPTQTQSS